MIIFLDRDGTINELGDSYITDPNELQLIPKSGEAIKIFNDLGYKVVVITNQSVIGEDMCDHQTMRKIHSKMDDLLSEYGAKVDQYLYCFHRKEENCKCRKPNIGLFEQAKLMYDFNPHETYMIGDNRCDVNFAKSTKMKSVLLLTGHGKEYETLCSPDYIFDNLYNFSVYFKEFHTRYF